jgi:NAD(P)-dependent dehydrogenase (short-subunit alcohol dehydrogenase family)
LDLFRLDGEVAAVIGGTGTLGGAIASGLAEAGAKVAVLGRRRKQGGERAQAITDGGGTAIYTPCDAMSPVSLQEAHQAVREPFGEVTVLVNGAGGVHLGAVVNEERAFEAVQLEEWARTFDLNLVAGALLPCQEFGPAMVRNGKGSIVNIASVSSHLPLSRVVAYSAAKAAVLSLTRFLAREWATTGVRVNSITPGFFPAEQNRRMLFHEDGSPTERTRTILAHTPMRRFGEPSELAGAAVFLASERASGFVTGADIVVDGGFLATTI